MDLKLKNTKTRVDEVFTPHEDNIVRVYSCGPTVYSRQHIGNMRAAVFIDILKRVLRYNGYTVTDVLNITDVGHLVSDEDFGEDKLDKKARESGQNPLDIARKFEKLYWKDLHLLNVIVPKFTPRATEHIPDQIRLIEKLEKNGYTYTTDDGVYFDTAKYEGYGALSGQDLSEKQHGARVDVRSDKRNPHDFALWKFLVEENKEHIMKWDSPWGKGFPGWHLECSAMSARYLGPVIDIHTGGVDHIAVHHENEIAQNECSGITTVRFWMHNNHLNLKDGKMSKSTGNVIDMDTIVDRGIDPLAFRYWLLTAHYSKKITFSWEDLEASAKAYRKLRQFSARDACEKCDEAPDSEYVSRFRNAINSDLNTAAALAIVWDLVKDESIPKPIRIETLVHFDSVLSLDIGRPFVTDIQSITPEVQELIDKRDKARRDKDWKLSDSLRDDLISKGFTVADTNAGTQVT